MTEVSRPSPDEDQSRGQAFNLGVLGVGGIVRLNMALRFEERHQFDIRGPFPDVANKENERLVNMLRGAIEQLADEDLDRAKEIVAALKNDRSAANEGIGTSQELAAECAPALVAHDYEFARDTLLDLYYNYGDYNDGCGGSDTAVGVMPEFRERLSPEQQADYDLHVQHREAW